MAEHLLASLLVENDLHGY
uniref:Uncharacterized protein n=1 Tax=Arundo donax TaxID=35708 RepID=A0A0A9C818_ARUDO